MGYLFVAVAGIASVVGTTLLLTFVSTHSLVVFAFMLAGLYLLRKIFLPLWRDAHPAASRLTAP